MERFLDAEIDDSDWGLYNKYTVVKNETGKPIDGSAFILRPDRDPAALKALETYAKSTPNRQLAKDLTKWIISIKMEGKNNENFF